MSKATQRRWRPWTAIVTGMLVLGLGACRHAETETIWQGKTMSTIWRVTIVNAPPGFNRDLIQQRLDQLEAIFSNWREDSAVSEWNASTSTEFLPVPREVAEVVEIALHVSRQTDGALDVTLAPLIDLWGFGPAGPAAEPPSEDAILAQRSKVGWEKLEVQLSPPRLRKRDARVAINLSTLVEGYAAEQISALLSANGCKVHLVDVGGAIVARGKPWRVAVQTPEAAAGEGLASVPLQDMTVTTAGTYRKHFESGGQRFAHIIDPRTGAPVSHHLVSVSVFHPSAAWADGYDTALLVLGPIDGRKRAQELRINAIFLEESSD